MKRIFTLLLFTFAVSNINAQELTICKDIHHLKQYEDHYIHKHRSPHADLMANYDIKYHRFDWQIDPSINYIAGSVTTRFEAVEDMTTIVFDLANNMIVDAAYQGEQSINYELNDELLTLYLNDEVKKGELDEVKIVYEGSPSSAGFGSFEASTHGANDTPVLWTLSEPYGAKAWWPCKQDLVDKIDSLDTYVTVPKGNRVASNGLLQSETAIEDDEKVIFHWKHNYEIPAYLVAIAVTDYAVFSDYVVSEDGDSLEILNYIFPEDLQEAETDLKSTIDQIQLFSELFGDYPFENEKYGHAQFGWGGGMEHQTMSFMGSFSFGLQAHELAHQWFGDKVTCGSWQDIWLNEGFATYLTGLSYENLIGEETFNVWKTNVINNVTSRGDGSVFVTDTTSVGRIFSGRLSYSKGAYLLHMLRWTLGDDDFFQACRNYLNDPKLAYGYATSPDLQGHLEALYGQSLQEFFDDWLYGQGYPSYNVNWWPLEEGKIGIQLEQSTSHSSVDFFEMPVPLRLEGENDTLYVRLDHTEDGQEFISDVPFEVQNVVFDPDKWILSRGNTVNMTSAVDETFLAGLIIQNPIQNELSISSVENIASMSIINTAGQRLLSKKSFNEVRFDVSNWSKGIYIINIEFHNGQSVTRKVVKM